MTMPTIRHILDLSTSHLPQRFFEEGCDLTGRHQIDYGMLLWVPDDPTDINNLGADEESDDAAPEIVRLRVYAREHGCDYILLDRDGEVDPNLPTWEW